MNLENGDNIENGGNRAEDSDARHHPNVVIPFALMVPGKNQVGQNG
jgi:hypothetical protein